MTAVDPLAESLQAAIRTIQAFVRETTGTAATTEELARALTRYFVLNEIKEFIVLERGTTSGKQRL